LEADGKTLAEVAGVTIVISFAPFGSQQKNQRTRFRQDLAVWL